MNMEIKYTQGFKDDMRRLFSRNPLYAIPRWFRDTKWRIEKAWQRVWIGYDEEWWWGFHHVFTETALANLKILKEKHSGHPGGIKDMAEWDAKLQEMIDGFEAAERIGDEWSTSEVDAELFKKGMATFTEYYFSLWD